MYFMKIAISVKQNSKTFYSVLQTLTFRPINMLDESPNRRTLLPNQLPFTKFIKHTQIGTKLTPLMFYTTREKYLHSQLIVLFQYYQNISSSYYTHLLTQNVTITTPSEQVNLVVFNIPRKQLFLTISKIHPIFIFTGGLMRRVMNEKRKSSKKMLKVATSLIKLGVILLLKPTYFVSGLLKLDNLGTLRSKVLKMLVKHKLYFKFTHIIITCPRSSNAQKFPTRRAIKKYVKKRLIK